MNLRPNIKFVVDNDICTGCGICEGSCPSRSISFHIVKGEFRPLVNEDKCNNDKGCHRCYDVCPGLGVNLVKIAEELQNVDGAEHNNMIGYYQKCFSGYSNDFDIRYHSASGGMVSQFLIWLLENDKIDGAVITKFDNTKPLMTDTFIATTKEEVVFGRSSKYGPVSMHHAVQDIKAASGSRYVVVGLPCHIQGFRKLMAIDLKLREKVVGLFALFCSSGRSFYLTEHVFKERGIDKNKLTYFQYRDEGCLGSMVAKSTKGSGKNIRTINSFSESVFYNEQQVYKEYFQSYYHPLRSFFIPRRCLFCIDHYGELADVCFGDIHKDTYIEDKIGVNSIIVKKKVWLELLVKCQNSGAVHLEEISFKTVSDSQNMSFKKKGRNGAFVNLGRKMGWVVPDYDVDYLRRPTLNDWLDYFQNRCQQFLGNHKWLWPVVTMLKSKVKFY